MNKGFIASVIASLAYGLSIVVTRSGVKEGLNPLSFTFFTMLFAAIVLSPYYFKKKTIRITIKDYRDFLILGLLASCIAHFLIFYGLTMTFAVNASFLVKMATPVTMLFAFSLAGERMNKLEIIATILMFVGIYFIITKGTMITPQTGDLFVLTAATILGFTNFYAKRIMRKHSPIIVVFWRMVFGALFLLIALLITKTQVSNSLGVYSLVNGALYGITVLSMYYSINKIGAALTSVLFFLSPLFGTIFAISLLGEKIALIQILGGSLIIIGAILIYKSEKENNL